MLDREVSRRLSLLRFPLIVGVVFIHAHGAVISYASESLGSTETSILTDLLRNTVSQGIARISVPALFFISGYLFFVGYQGAWSSYVQKLHRRVRTLLLPFLFWNASNMLLLVAVYSIPGTRRFLSGSRDVILSLTPPSDFLAQLLGVGRMPAAYQFWFVRDLMVLVLLAPLILWCVRRAPALFIAVLSICWLADAWMLPIPSAEAVLFFSVGSLLSVLNAPPFPQGRWGTAAVIAYPLALVLNVSMIGTATHPFIYRIGVATGVVAALHLTQFASASATLEPLLLRLSDTSFFVFAFHEPLLTVIRKLSYVLIRPTSDLMTSLLYLLAPLATIVIALATWSLLDSVAPRFAQFITGGRPRRYATNNPAAPAPVVRLPGKGERPLENPDSSQLP